MRIASWNVNHRAGRTRFRPEAADAAIELDADLLLFNECFPQQHADAFAAQLENAGWCHQLWSGAVPELANRVFAASRFPIERDMLPLGTFDHQLPSNTLPIRFPDSPLRVLALRIPAYSGATRSHTDLSWEWLAQTAAELAGAPAVIIGDLNADPRLGRKWERRFEPIRSSGWVVANSLSEPSYFSARGTSSTLDYLLHTDRVQVAGVHFACVAGKHRLANGPAALSDHAALVADLLLDSSAPKPADR